MPPSQKRRAAQDLGTCSITRRYFTVPERRDQFGHLAVGQRQDADIAAEPFAAIDVVGVVMVRLRCKAAQKQHLVEIHQRVAGNQRFPADPLRFPRGGTPGHGDEKKEG
jgi:hypothetical protein